MKTVLVTGGATGIGAAACRLFARRGYQVAINYFTSGTAAAALETELRNMGYAVKSFPCDITKEQQVIAMAHQVKDTFGSLDVVVNNSGTASQTLFTDTSEAQWQQIFDVNVKGAFLVSREAVKLMLKNHEGAIVNISSMWGQVGASCEVAYSASKAALIGMTKALAKEVGLSGIRVNCICPGMIDTAMNSAIPSEIQQEIREETPLNRLGTPDDIANAALFLAGKDASFITGQIIGVNGGFVI